MLLARAPTTCSAFGFTNRPPACALRKYNRGKPIAYRTVGSVHSRWRGTHLADFGLSRSETWLYVLTFWFSSAVQTVKRR